MISGAELLEQAVALCRANRDSSLVAYWIGTAPFVTGLLYFCEAMTGSATADEQILPLSLMLAILWMWMNFWHTICCDGLWQSVSEERAGGWSFACATRLLLTNVALQGPGMFVLGMALMISLPFPWAHAFLQNCHVYAARFDLRETSRRAAHHAGLWPKQNWQLLSCVLFLGVVLFLNLILAIYVGAHLLNSVFGVQTALVQNRTAILSVPYLAAAACITFMILDPLWKAAHVIRCFHGESMRTGADLRLLLRRVSVIAAIAFSIVPTSAQTIPTQKYDRAIKEVLQRPEYEWTGRAQPRPAPADSALQRNLEAIRQWAEQALQWLDEWLRNLSSQPQQPPAGAPPGTSVRWAILGALALCVLVVGVLAIRSRTRQPKSSSVSDSVPMSAAVDLADEQVTPDRLPTNEWLQLADGFLRSGDTRLAARAVYLAALSQLEGENLITLGRHKTNLEYERELARRAKGLPRLSSTFRTIIDTFEQSWYGRHHVDEQRVLEIKTSLSGLKSHA